MDLLFDRSPRKQKNILLRVYSSENRFVLVLEGELCTAYRVNICRTPYAEVPNPQELFWYFDNITEIEMQVKDLSLVDSIILSFEQAESLAHIFKHGVVHAAEYLCPTRSEYLAALFKNHETDLKCILDALTQAVSAPEKNHCCRIL